MTAGRGADLFGRAAPSGHAGGAVSSDAAVPAAPEEASSAPDERPGAARRPLPSPAGLLVLLFTLAAFAVRALTLTQQSLWLDEVDALGFAARPAADLVAMMAQPAQNGPLYYLLLKGWVALVGPSEFGLRSLSLLAGVPAIPLTYRAGRQLAGTAVGVWGALLAACSPYLLWYGQEGKMYALYLTLTLVSMTLFLDGLARGGRQRWAGWLLVTAAGVYVHLFMVFLPLAQHGLAAALAALGMRPKGWSGWWVMQGAALLAVVPVAAWGAPAVLGGYRTAFDPAPLATVLRVLLLRFSLHTESWPPPLLLAPFLAALGAAGWAALMGQPRRGPVGRGALLLAVWLLVPVLAAALVTLRAPVFLHRYFMLIAPAYTLLLACGVVALTARPRTAALGWLCGISLVGASLNAAAHPTETRPDFRAAAAYVAARAAPGDRALFVAAYAERAFRYYLPAGRLPGGGAPYANGGLALPEASAAIEAAAGAAGRVWLIEHEEWLWDAEGLTARWLSGRGPVGEAALFPGVRVTAFATDAH